MGSIRVCAVAILALFVLALCLAPVVRAQDSFDQIVDDAAVITPQQGNGTATVLQQTNETVSEPPSTSDNILVSQTLETLEPGNGTVSEPTDTEKQAEDSPASDDRIDSSSSCVITPQQDNGTATVLQQTNETVSEPTSFDNKTLVIDPPPSGSDNQTQLSPTQDNSTVGLPTGTASNNDTTSDANENSTLTGTTDNSASGQGGTVASPDDTDTEPNADTLNLLKQWEQRVTAAKLTVSDYQDQLTALLQRLDTVENAVAQNKREVARIETLVRALLADDRCSYTDRRSLQGILRQIAAFDKLAARAESGIADTRALPCSDAIQRVVTNIASVAAIIDRWQEYEATKQFIMLPYSPVDQQALWRADIESGLAEIDALMKELAGLLPQVLAGAELAENQGVETKESLQDIRATYTDVDDAHSSHPVELESAHSSSDREDPIDQLASKYLGGDHRGASAHYGKQRHLPK